MPDTVCLTFFVLLLLAISPTGRYWGPYSGIEDYELKERIMDRGWIVFTLK